MYELPAASPVYDSVFEDPTVGVTVFGYPVTWVVPSFRAFKTICVIDEPDGVVVTFIDVVVLELKAKFVKDIASPPFRVFDPKGREVGVIPVLSTPLYGISNAL